MIEVKVMSTPEEDAKLMIRAFTKGIEAGVKHYHPKTGVLLTTVRKIIETLLAEGTINIDFGDEGNQMWKAGYEELK